jgi:hypothetical protein
MSAVRATLTSMRLSTALVLVLASATSAALAHPASLQAAAPGAPAAAQASPAFVDPETVRPKARAEDVRSIEAIIAAVYDVISGPAGPRDWNRFKSLLLPECRLMPVSHLADAQAVYRTLDAEAYIQRAEPAFAKQGFFETGVANRVEEFGSIAHVFSTYESRREQDGARFARGINSFQLVKLGDRWWVASIMWDTERPDVPIPGSALHRCLTQHRAIRSKPRESG